MAYVNMFRNEHCMDPRISFSNDLALKREKIKYTEAPVSSDFEFRIEGHDLIAADEIFYGGVLLPLTNDGRVGKATLRDELESLEGSNGGGGGSGGGAEMAWRRLKDSRWWKEKLGLRSKKDQKKA